MHGPKVRKPNSSYQSGEGIPIDGQAARERLKKLKSAANKDGQTSKERHKKLKTAANNGYLTFAAKSTDGPTIDSTCRSYGGQPVVGEHYDVVMGSGRIDDTLHNVLYYGGYHYVTFKISEPNPIRRAFGPEIGLCQF